MDDLPLRLKTFLSEAASRLHDSRLPEELTEAMSRLSTQVDQPCVVAVVGRMKAGKSTFINALLGEDLAKVGVTETTATINYFRYGCPNPARPVRCHWQNGSVTEEERAFVDGLQGNDAETLRRAAGIKCLEYHLLNPYLERVTLVDTPGMCATVDEHVERTAEFFALQRQVRDRHNAETERLGSEADAVIYLTSQVARVTDQAFLEDFQEVTGGRAKPLNAIGVMAKIDLHLDVLRRRDELAEKISTQLKNSLNRVVPVSAGIKRTIDRLREEGAQGLAHFVATLQRIPPRCLDKFLDSEEFYRELEPEDCPVTITERVLLMGDMPWAVFTTLARSAASVSFDIVAAEALWHSLTGFDRLRELLDRHLVRRAQFLRCYRIIRDARRLLDEVRFRHLPEQVRQEREQKAKLNKFIQFVRGAAGDPNVANELEEFLVQQSGLQGGGQRVESAWKELDRRLAVFFHEVEDLNEDFAALQTLDEHGSLFSAAELHELRSLLGLYGLKPTARLQGKLDLRCITERQGHWLQVHDDRTCKIRRLLAERAVTVYGGLLAVLELA